MADDKNEELVRVMTVRQHQGRTEGMTQEDITLVDGAGNETHFSLIYPDVPGGTPMHFHVNDHYQLTLTRVEE